MKNEIEIEFKHNNGKVETFCFSQKELEAIFAVFHAMALQKFDLDLRKQLGNQR